jgi:hypothetical protein
MATVTGRALRQTQSSFQRVVMHMEDMHNACEIRPSAATAVLRSEANADGTATIRCLPVVCRVPERANHHTANLYVVLEGWIMVRLGGDGLATVNYSTNFGYFLMKDDRIRHALGGHHDYAVDPAHPRAHMQLASQARLHENARQNFPSIDSMPLDDDVMTRVLHRVRTPTAQMDFLSFMLQIAADHLVGDPTAEQQFRALCESCVPVKGYNISAPLSPCDCHRAAHWYPH